MKLKMVILLIAAIAVLGVVIPMSVNFINYATRITEAPLNAKVTVPEPVPSVVKYEDKNLSYIWQDNKTTDLGSAKFQVPAHLGDVWIELSNVRTIYITIDGKPYMTIFGRAEVEK